jgi:hypothetical protein
VAALVPRQEIEGDMGASTVGVQARLMSQAMRKLSSVISRTNAIVIFINQLREKVGVIYGNPETTPGGRALKFFSSVRIDVRKGEQLKEGGNAYGNHVKQVWMSCAGLQNLNQRIILPLIKQQRNIILYPDRDGIANWKSKAEALHYANVRVDEKPVTEWWKPQDGEKADIADVVMRMINAKKIYKTVDEVVDDLPQLKELKERLNLELHHDEGKT